MRLFKALKEAMHDFSSGKSTTGAWVIRGYFLIIALVLFWSFLRNRG